MRRYNVVIVEPSTVIAEGLAAMLRRGQRCEVLGAYPTIAEIQSMLYGNRIDVVLASMSLYQRIEECAELSNIPVVGIQSALYEEDVVRRFRTTINIYTSAEDVERAVYDAVDSPVEHSFSESHELSERERDVLILVAKGYTNKEIASELNISPHTVISHRKNIVHKTGIRSVAGLTVYAVLNKLIDSEQI